MPKREEFRQVGVEGLELFATNHTVAVPCGNCGRIGAHTCLWEPKTGPLQGMRALIETVVIPKARRTDPPTSHSAAASVGKVKALRQHILRLYDRYGPMTDDELVGMYNVLAVASNARKATPQNIRSRRAELVKAGLVKDSGRTQLGPSGRAFTVWQKV